MLDEDIFVNNFFKNKKKGIYLDVGAYHPLEGNNTYLLYKKKNWRGVNIDVNPLSIKLFQRSRKGDLNINSAISNKKGVTAFYFRKKINMLNTLNKKIAKLQFKNGFQKKQIKTNTLNNILRESKYVNKKIDFFNLDVEGHELQVLKSINLKKYKPTLICVEIHNQEEMFNHNTDYLKRNPVNKLLLNHRYSIVWNNRYSYIYKLMRK
jgi:FkbM family methyltransferase